MAVQIPTYRPQVASRALSAPQIQTVAEDSGMFKLGEQALSTAGKIADTSMQNADNAALIGAESQLSNWKLNTMFNKDTGVYSRKGSNALDITNETLGSFDQQADAIGNSLTNERQRARWNQIVASQRNSFSGELNRYEFGERQRFYDEQDQASLTSAQAGATAYFMDPSQVAYYQNKGSAVIIANGQRKGLPQEAIAQNIQKFNSNTATTVIQRMAVEDPLKAQQYYASAANYMTPEDQLEVSKLLGTSVRKQIGAQIGQAVYNTGSIGEDALPALIIQAESGGDPTAVSPKGARGIMQLMPETAKEMAAKLEIPYDENRLNDPQYNMALGTAYINEMRGRYNGNPVLAVAAYNAGPGKVDEWVKQYGDPRKGEISNEEFVERIPFDETRNYTSKIVGQLQGGRSAARDYADATRQINKIDDEGVRKYAQDKVDDLHKAQQLEDKANYEDASSYVMSGGFSTIPSSLLTKISADDQLKLQKMDDYRRKGTQPETDYGKLQGFLDMPPEQLAGLSLERDVRPYLNNSDFNRIVTAYQDAKQGNGSAKVQQALKAEENMVRLSMGQAGILTGESQAAQQPKNIEAQAQWRAAYQARKDAFAVGNKGEQPNAEQAKTIADQMVMEVRLEKSGYDPAVRMWEVAPEQMESMYIDKGDVALSDIPPMDRQQIIVALRNQDPPVPASEANIIGAYIERISGLGVKVK